MTEPLLFKLTLTKTDRELINDYGYAFPDFEKALEAVPESQDTAEILCPREDVKQLLGNLAISINECMDQNLLEDLDELYECIEQDTGL
jgi:hypothetical protein